MKKNWKAAFVLITMACILAAGILSCKTEVDNDTVAPAEATDLAAQSGDSTATLTWTNPADTDFYGVEVSASPAAGTLANPVVLTGAAATLTVTGLTNATEYTFTVKTIDKSLNTSTGTTVTATPADSSDKTAPAEVTSLAVGDIVLSDGTKVAVDAVSSITAEQAGKAVAVICSTLYGGGTVLGVGLKQSSLLSWAPSGTTGYTTNFTDIVCTPSAAGSGAASTATFTGDTDGSDNWDVVCSVDPTGTASDVMATNYPAFNYAVNYGTTNSLPTNYTDGWYMPSIAELCAVYKNMEAINTSITAINEVSSGSATAIKSSWYYSSSQYGSNYYDAWGVDFYSGLVPNFSKISKYSVLVVRAF